MHVALSQERLHRVMDDLPTDKLPALADLIHTLMDEDDEPLDAEMLADYRRIRNEMRCGNRVSQAVMSTLRFSRQAPTFLKKPPPIRNRIRASLLEWAKDALANRQVSGTDTLLRLRVGDIRVLFSPKQEGLLMLIIAIGHRGDSTPVCNVESEVAMEPGQPSQICLGPSGGFRHEIDLA